MKVLLLSRYEALGASSRVRYLQYISYFKEHDVDVTVVPLFSDTYLRALYEGGSRRSEVLAGYVRRVGALLRAHRFNLLVVEKELFPFVPAFAEWLLRISGVPYVVDYDDALFHRYDLHPRALVRKLLGRKIDAVMRHAAVVVAGNDYLADRSRQAGAFRVEVIPTAVDTERYQPRIGAANVVPIIGWIGTPKTSRYLQPLLPVFASLKEDFDVRFVLVGARAEDFAGSPMEAWPWSEMTEVASIQQFDIGIMPLENSPWEQGKCGYKLIQYMACGVPVVASPVGVNQQIVYDGVNGYLADTLDAWYESLARLLRMPSEGLAAMGREGRKQIKAEYSREVQAPRLLDIFHKVAR